MRWIWTRSRRDRFKELPKVLERARTPRSLAVLREETTERPSAARDRKVVAKESRRVRRMATAKVPGKA